MTVIVNMNKRIYDTCSRFAGAIKAPSLRLQRRLLLPSLRLLLLLPLLVLLLQSCGNDYGIDTQEENPEIRFRLKLPADVPQAGTYAMSDSEELQLSSATVLAFAKSGGEGDDDYYFGYMRTGAISQSGQNATITIMPEKGNQCFLVLANCNSELGLPGNAVSTLDRLADVLGKLTVIEAQEWPAGNASEGVKPIPMAVLTGEYSIGNGLTTIGNGDPVNLIRMLARIDVSLHEDITNFKLVSACLFNRNDRGYIAYNPDEDYWDETSKKVTHAWVPATAQTVMTPSLDDYYPAAYTIDDPHGAIRKSIYTFESVGSADKQAATCIVVGGYYNYPANSTKTTYYRLDIPQIPGGDILRNHLYDIKIDEVLKAGAASAEEAVNGTGPATLQAGITEWNLADTRDADLTGRQDRDAEASLSIDKVSLSYFSAAVSARTVSVTSSQSWTASTSQTWITNVTASGASGTRDLSFALQANTGNERTGYITVTSGNLTTQVTIVQSQHAALTFGDGVSGTAGTYSTWGVSSAQSFTVTYYSPWRAVEYSDGGNVIKFLHNFASMYTTTFPVTETFRFTTTGTASGTSAVIRFTSPTSVFDPVDVSITVQ